MKSIPDTLEDFEEKLKKDVHNLGVGISQVASLYLQLVEEKFSENLHIKGVLVLPLHLVEKLINSLNKIPNIVAFVREKVSLDEDMGVTLRYMEED